MKIGKDMAGRIPNKYWPISLKNLKEIEGPSVPMNSGILKLAIPRSLLRGLPLEGIRLRFLWIPRGLATGIVIKDDWFGNLMKDVYRILFFMDQLFTAGSDSPWKHLRSGIARPQRLSAFGFKNVRKKKKSCDENEKEAARYRLGKRRLWTGVSSIMKECFKTPLFGKVDKPFHHEGDHENDPDNKSQDQEFH